MCYECSMAYHGAYLCPVDRKVWKEGYLCPQCGKTGIQMGMKWRAPKKTDEKAWQRVQRGDFLWENKNYNNSIQMLILERSLEANILIINTKSVELIGFKKYAKKF
jgi:hypothetical protein